MAEESYREYVAGNLERLRRPGRVPSPCVTPSPTGTVIVGGGTPLHPVTESCGDAIARLTDVLNGILGRDLPGVELRNARDGSALPPLVERDPHWATAYAAGFGLGEGEFRSVLGLTVYAAAESPERQADYLPCAAGNPNCGRLTVGATIVLIHRGDRPMAVQLNAYRPDGTSMILVGRAAAAGNKLPFTEEQLLSIVTAPELTLYP
ncbi:hypothetical protein [Dactylosporangium sp. CA-092794]|uniref:hypothetical protein n=1 Tax=Dactylosporangium sp. CA-092794 TaxID=3239929 RepID=UPI003D8A75C0